VAFQAEQASEQDQLRRRITRARKLLARVEIDHELLMLVAALCVSLKVDGHRGELTIARGGRALAAFEGRASVEAADVERVAVMSLRHRLRRDPLETVDSGARIQEALSELISMLSTKSRLRVVK